MFDQSKVAFSHDRSKFSEILDKSIDQKTEQKNDHLTKSVIDAKKTSTYMDSDFWYHKGVVLNQKLNNKAALKCYKQALKLQQDHTPSIFNLACNYEKEGEYDEAKIWFLKAVGVKKDWPDAYYGLSLVCIRLGQTQEAVNYINLAVEYSPPDNIEAQVLYVRALAFKLNHDYDNALKYYRVIMKNELTIFDYQNMISKINEKMRKKHMTEDPIGLNWQVDMYTQFRSLNLLREYNPYRYINLWPYFTSGSGWNIDEIDKVIDLIMKVRFFNRFDSDALTMMLSNVTLTKIEESGIMFLEDNEAAFVVSGQLYLYSHLEDVASPCLNAIFNPGDVIGLPEIANGKTVN